MIPSHRALVPFSAARRAAMEAILAVENRTNRGHRHADYPYARAFFRAFNGSKRVTAHDISYFSAGMTDKELRGHKESWLSAIDTLIESRGERCYLPLAGNAGASIFPEVFFRDTERRDQRISLSVHKGARLRLREEEHRKALYQAKLGQAAIELAHHTPDSLGTWWEGWEQHELNAWDLDRMVWAWIERTPSLQGVEKYIWSDCPLWAVMGEVRRVGNERDEQAVALDAWMLPNKLTCREVQNES